MCGLILEIGGRELEVACYCFTPAEKGEEVSERMMVGAGYGAVWPMLPFQTTERPTIIRKR
jgi:hypothetical protein